MTMKPKKNTYTFIENDKEKRTPKQNECEYEHEKASIEQEVLMYPVTWSCMLQV